MQPAPRRVVAVHEVTDRKVVPVACFVRTAGELSDFISAPRLHDLPVGDFVHCDDPPRRWLQLLDSLP